MLKLKLKLKLIIQQFVAKMGKVLQYSNWGCQAPFLENNNEYDFMNVENNALFH